MSTKLVLRVEWNETVWTGRYPFDNKKFRTSARKFLLNGSRPLLPEITALLTRALDVALYLEHLMESDTSSSVLHSASCGISWANKLYGFPVPCQDPLARNILEAGARIFR